MNPTVPPPVTDPRIPVYLLTGYLGSGKTSLLKAWLAQPELKEAALIINELGEVGLDNQLLSVASESAALVANACVCCTGLPGLAEAMEDLFWARLHRRMLRFSSLVIETTGLAEPAPVVQALHGSDLLRERYRLAGVITCLSATTADAVLGQHAEARAQLSGANVLVLTKTDLVDGAALDRLKQRLEHQLAHQGQQIVIATSAQASLSAVQMLQCLQEGVCRASQAPDYAHDHGSTQGHVHTNDHNHSAQAYWWSLPDEVNGQALLTQIQSLKAILGPALLRLKGRVLTDQGPWLVQLAPFELQAEITPDTLPSDTDMQRGLTMIVALPLSASQSKYIAELATLNDEAPTTRAGSTRWGAQCSGIKAE
jgi:G3E family GTPase